jgi:hypothetical protein
MSVKLTGFEKINKKLERIYNIKTDIREPANDAADLIYGVAQRYPPKRAGSKYVRTMTLQRSWIKRVEPTANGVRIIAKSTGANQGFGNYEHYVKSATRQAKIHEGFWPTVKDDAAEVSPQVIAIFSEWISRMVNK